MSKLIIEVDTEEKTMAVTVDGEKLKNCEYAEVYQLTKDRYGTDGVQYIVCQYEVSDTGVKKQTYIMASETPIGQEAIKNGARAHATLVGHVIVPGKTSFEESAYKFFTKKQNP